MKSPALKKLQTLNLWGFVALQLADGMIMPNSVKLINFTYKMSFCAIRLFVLEWLFQKNITFLKRLKHLFEFFFSICYND